MELSVTLDQLCARTIANRPDEPAIEFENQWIHWHDMQAVAEQVSNLIEASGAGENPKVAFVARNRPSALAAFLALLAKKCTVRMVYPFQSAESIATELGEIRPALVLASESDYADIIKDTLAEQNIAAIALNEMSANAVTGLEKTSVTDTYSQFPEVILLTSGTTGRPKQFPIDYGTLEKYFTGAAAQITGNKIETQAQLPMLLYFPVSNISGLYSTLPPLLNGFKIVLLDRFKLELWLDFVERYKPQYFGMPPAAFKMILDADVPLESFASLKSISAGAAPLDPAVQKAFEEKYNIPVLLSYGATEFGGPVAGMTFELWQEFGKQKLGSVGRAYTGMKLRVIDPNTGAELPAGTEGILEVVSMRIGPDWIRTSDLAIIDEDGFLFLKGRADGAIIRGGFKLVPAVIEEALLKNPDIAMVSVIGIPDQRLGQVPAAAIVLKPNVHGVTAKEIETDLRRHIPATYIPTTWKFIPELPRTPSMKVDMPAVRQLFAD